MQQIEHLIVRLLTHEYLQEEYHEISYNRVVYVAPGRLAARLSYHTRQSIKGEVKRKLEFPFTSSTIKSGTKLERKSGDSSQLSASKKRKVSEKSSKAKGKMKAVEPDDQDDFGDEDEPTIIYSDQDGIEDASFLSNDDAPQGPSQKLLDNHVPNENFSDDNDDDADDYQWSRSLLEEPRPRFKAHVKKQTKVSNRFTMNIIQEGDNEVMVLSSD